MITLHHHDHVFDPPGMRCRFCGRPDTEIHTRIDYVCTENPMATLELTEKELDQAVADWLKRHGVQVIDLAQIKYRVSDGAMEFPNAKIVARIHDVTLAETGGPYR